MLKNKPLIGSLVLLVGLQLAMPLAVGAQCVFTSSNQGTGFDGGMEYRYITKYLTTSASCMFVASNSARDCDPSGTTSTSSLVASAFVSDFMGPGVAVCSWICDCGTVTVTQVDLPVELMDFAVEVD